MLLNILLPIFTSQWSKILIHNILSVLTDIYFIFKNVHYAKYNNTKLNRIVNGWKNGGN